MNCRCIVHWLLCGCLLAGPLSISQMAQAEDTPAEPATQEAKDSASLVDQVKENPDNTELLNKWIGGEFQTIFSQLQSDPDAAEKALDELSTTLESLEPTEAQAKSLVSRGNAVIKSFRQRIALARITLEEASETLKANPADETALRNYTSKVTAEAGAIARSEPLKAEKQLEAAKTLLNELSENAEEEEVQDRIASALKNLSRLDRTIASAKKLLELVGKDSAPLNVEAWVNGKPLEEGDLKGKVVLLDFWAVWCGPCIATFPHLREWHETYADKGLEIVGLTRYYGYEWNAEAGKASRSKEEVTPEAEQEMLAKFAEEHDLKHRFAIQSDRELSDYYAVSGIPHVVVIDQEGKIRMIRVGSGSKNAEDISKLLAELMK